MKFNKKIDNLDLDNYLVSKYSMIKTDNEENISIKTSLTYELYNDDLPSYAKNEYKPKSKIGYIKEGFWIIFHINPIYRYNFLIDRYNEDINIYNKIMLHRIPLHKYISRYFDIYIYISRIIFAVILISLGICSKNNVYKYYSICKPFKWINNTVLILMSFIGLFL